MIGVLMLMCESRENGKYKKKYWQFVCACLLIVIRTLFPFDSYRITNHHIYSQLFFSLKITKY